VTKEKIDIVTIQETKLKPTTKTPTIAHFTAIRTDRTHKDGGGLMTYVKNDITFTDINIPQNINRQATEVQYIKLYLSNNKQLEIFNLYVPPRDCRNPNHATAETPTTRTLTTT
jgi:exonuclease III